MIEYMKKVRKKTKLRVLFLYDFPLWGSGSGNFLRHLAVQLIKDKFSVGIIAPERRRFHKKIKQYTINPPQIPVFVGHPELKQAKKYCELSNHELTAIYTSYLHPFLRAIKDFQPHIVHVNHLSLIAWVARYAKSLTNVKYIITSHGSDLHNIEQDKRLRLLTIDSLRGASQITTVSGDTRAWLIKMFGTEFSSKLRTIPGGIDINLFPAKGSTKTVDKKYKLKGKKVVLFAGRLTSQKGVKYLVKASKKIKGEVFIIGEGPEKKKLQQEACRLKLENIHFLGYFGRRRTKEFREFYYRSDVFVAPSIWQEPLGLVILEAMACQTPVVVTRKGGIPLAVKEGFNGFFVRPRNSNDLAEKINKLLVDSKLRWEMGRNARKIVEEKFTWEKIVKRFEKIYERHTTNKNQLI